MNNILSLNHGECLTIDELRFLMRYVEISQQNPETQLEVVEQVIPDLILPEDREPNTPLSAISAESEISDQRVPLLESQSTTSEDNSSTDQNLCSICQEVPENPCYPSNCHSTHVMCYPHCVSRFAYMMRQRRLGLQCPCCRTGFESIVVTSDPTLQPREIPRYSDVVRNSLPPQLQNEEGCHLCWGIYNPMPCLEDYFHKKTIGHRGRHRTMPSYYAILSASSEGGNNN